MHEDNWVISSQQIKSYQFIHKQLVEGFNSSPQNPKKVFSLYLTKRLKL